MRKNGTFYLQRKRYIDYKVVVVDEVSMLPKTMWNLLLSHRKYVIACGDPGQLPVLFPDEDNHVLDHPHIFLDEIMRQAQDSEIIRFSMWIRQGKPIGAFPVANEQVMVCRKKQEIPEMYEWADQVICATNEKRIDINNIVRARQDRGPTPEVGDKIIGLTNHWDFLSTNGQWALTNGVIGTITNFQVMPYFYPPYIYDKEIKFMFTGMDIDNGRFEAIPIDYQAILTGEQSLTNKDIYKINQYVKDYGGPDAPYFFAYAYAITCWKAQGSEFDKVLLIEENHPFDRDTHIKYLYTGITRAKSKLVLIRR